MTEASSSPSDWWKPAGMAHFGGWLAWLRVSELISACIEFTMVFLESDGMDPGCEAISEAATGLGRILELCLVVFDFLSKVSTEICV